MANTTNMVFSESTNKTGMYERFQDLTATNSTSYSAYKYARDANNALLDYQMLALHSNGGWQFDDTNQSAAGIKSINVVSGTNNYNVLVDDETNANQILEIERVECAIDASLSNYNVLTPYNEMDSSSSITQDATQSGVPNSYYIRGGTIFLYPKPNFNATAGLKVWISRTTTYFAGTDTTKVAGIPHTHQKYLVLKPAYEYCAVSLPQRAGGIFTLLQLTEKEIKEYYSIRKKDERNAATTKQIRFR
jgi:hypothetical protein